MLNVFLEGNILLTDYIKNAFHLDDSTFNIHYTIQYSIVVLPIEIVFMSKFFVLGENFRVKIEHVC